MKKWHIHMWGEGQAVDAWTINHTLFGCVGASATHLLSIDYYMGLAAIILLAIIWEIYEKQKGIKETLLNQVTDVVVALVGFVITIQIIEAQIVDPFKLLIGFMTTGTILGIWGYMAYKKRNK